MSAIDGRPWNKATATRLRRKNERTVSYIVHEPLCLYSDGLIIPSCRCTCGSKRKAYTNVLILNAKLGI